MVCRQLWSRFKIERIELRDLNRTPSGQAEFSSCMYEEQSNRFNQPRSASVVVLSARPPIDPIVSRSNLEIRWWPSDHGQKVTW